MVKDNTPLQTSEHEPSDEQLLSAYRETGDEQLFVTLVNRYESDLYSYLHRYLNDAQLAEDVFQATFLQIYLKSEHFDTQRKFRPWLYTVATNQAIDAQRRNKRHKHPSLQQTVEPGSQLRAEMSLQEVLPVSGETPEHILQEQEQGQFIRRLIERLPGTLREVVHLIYYEGMKYREAAVILELPVGTVKSRLHTAMRKLEEMLRKNQEH